MLKNAEFGKIDAGAGGAGGAGGANYAFGGKWMPASKSLRGSKTGCFGMGC